MAPAGHAFVAGISPFVVPALAPEDPDLVQYRGCHRAATPSHRAGLRHWCGQPWPEQRPQRWGSSAVRWLPAIQNGNLSRKREQRRCCVLMCSLLGSSHGCHSLAVHWPLNGLTAPVPPASKPPSDSGSAGLRSRARCTHTSCHWLPAAGNRCPGVSGVHCQWSWLGRVCRSRSCNSLLAVAWLFLHQPCADRSPVIFGQLIPVLFCACNAPHPSVQFISIRGMHFTMVVGCPRCKMGQIWEIDDKGCRFAMVSGWVYT